MGLGITLGLSVGDKNNYYYKYTWVATDGSDSTGDGTFANPYKTMAKIETLTLTGDKATIKVKAGTYSEAHNTYRKAYKYVAVGEVILTNSSTNYVIKPYTSAACNSSFNGFTINGTGLASGKPLVNLQTGQTGTITFINCKFINPVSDGYGIFYQNTASPALSMSGCSFTGNCYNWICDISTSVDNSYTWNIDNCTFNGSCSNVATITSGDGSNGTSVGSNTITITNCLFYKNPVYNDIHIGKSGTYIIRDNRFEFTTNTTSGRSVVKLNTGTGMTSSVTGTIDISNNIVQCNGYTFNNCGMFDLFESVANKALFGVTINNNRITGTSTTLGSGNTSTGIINVVNASSIVCNYNQIDISSSVYLYYGINIVQELVDVSAQTNSVNYNIVKFSHPGAYGIKINTDSAPTNIDYLDGIQVLGNLIYGCNYYGTQQAGQIQHSLFVGYMKDFLIAYNTIIGGGAIIYEHNNESTASSGSAIINNILIDCKSPLVIAGLNSAKVYGNTIVNRRSDSLVMVTAKWNDTMAGIVWDDENPTPITDVKIVNNIIYSTGTASNYGLISVSEHCSLASGGSDYNLLHTNYLTRLGVYQGSDKTRAEWLALGFDGNSVWDGSNCVVPELSDIVSAMGAVNVTPTSGSNVIGVGDALGVPYNTIIAANGAAPFTLDKITTQDVAYTIGAVKGE